MSRIVLAYSGGLDTSVLLKKLILEGHEVVAMTAQLGESDALVGAGSDAANDAVKAKAVALGAYDAVSIDARETFVTDYVQPALRANVLYQGVYPLSAALSRPLIAALLVETAREYGATVVAHGCTGKGNDQVRIEVATRAIAPTMECRAPLRDHPMSRPEAMAFAADHGVPVSHTVEKPYSIDANLWGRSIEAGVLEEPWNSPPEDAYAWTASPRARPAEADEVCIEFQDGVPACDGLKGPRLVAYLNALAGKHGIGRIDLIEDRVVGLKSREVYECPGALTLIAAHAALERLVLTRDELRFKSGCDRRYAELVYDGLWPQPLRAALDAFNASFAIRMTGTVRVRLHQGQPTVAGLASPFGLYQEHLATYGVGDRFDHHAAGGFIALHGLPLEAHAQALARKMSMAN
jgi:argininosuccinate synthase